MGEPFLGATLEDSEVRMSTITHNRFWRTLTALARVDIAINLSATAALLIWMALR
jgi:galactose-1-phosphate uridylyltransferase